MIAPAISVVLAVHNGERHLQRSIASVLSQTLANFELIVVDDGSTDATPQLLAAAAGSDARVIVIRREHRGLAESLNAGIARARGRYIARQDADDVSMPDRFTRQIAYLDAHDEVGALGSSAEVIDPAGHVVGALTAACGAAAVRRALLTLRTTPVHGSMMIRKRAIETSGGYRPSFRAGQDYDLWLRLSEHDGVDNLPDALYQWRLDPESVYATRRAMQLKYAGIARAFARERATSGADSYELLERCAGDLDRFAQHYRLGAFLHAMWGELLLRGLGNSAAVREQFRSAVSRGNLRPRTLGLFAWTHLGLPWPGGPARARRGAALPPVD
jgi:glycosyltransferase involved in cell wall biosynthesis